MQMTILTPKQQQAERLKPYQFKKGHKVNQGRPLGSVDSKRVYITKMFLDKTIEEWPQIAKKIFEEALKGNNKMLSLIVEFAIAKPSHIVIEAEDSNQMMKVEDAENLSTDELRAILSTFAKKNAMQPQVRMKQAKQIIEGEIVND